MACRACGLFENQNLNHFWCENALVRKKTEEVHTYLELFYSLPGITQGREVCVLDAGERPFRTPPHKVVGSEFYFQELFSWNSAFIQGGVFSSLCPESEPICLATRNNQSRFSAIPSASGTSAAEDGVNARLHGCTEWLAVAMSRALPTHPHVHNVTD